jgi:hypothetical protein
VSLGRGKEKSPDKKLKNTEETSNVQSGKVKFRVTSLDRAQTNIIKNLLKEI